MPKRRLADMVADRYEDPEVRQHVLGDVQRLGTMQQIESGELVLPTEQDAIHWYERKQGIATLNPEQRREKARLNALEQLVIELHAAMEEPTDERRAAITERITALKEGGD